jgi:hypothetical protein
MFAEVCVPISCFFYLMIFSLLLTVSLFWILIYHQLVISIANCASYFFLAPYWLQREHDTFSIKMDVV